MSKSVSQTYQKLDDIEHVRLRTGMYAGSTEPTTKEQWFYNPSTAKMEKASLTTIPAFVKIFSEILDNAIDEGRRAPDTLDTIKVTFDQQTGEISVWDNGRGIPVHAVPNSLELSRPGKFSVANLNSTEAAKPQTITITFTTPKKFKVEGTADGNIGVGEVDKCFTSKVVSFDVKTVDDEPYQAGDVLTFELTYVAEMIFSNLRSGSNFNDDEDQQLIGTNGVGSTLTNILSTEFNVESCDGKKMLRQTFSEGMRKRTEPKITANSRNHTEIRFTPDYAFFKLEGLNDDHVRRMTKKVVDAVACNPRVKFFVNGQRINVKDFGDYVALYDVEHVYDDTTDWKVGISYSDSEFEQISFVNSVETFEGGTHVWYVMDQITAELREYIKKKYKEDVKPGDIRAHMRVYISANVNRPKFSSQTKENMISLPGSYQTSWTVPESFIRKLVKSPIINSVMDLVKAKNMAAELKELRENSKNLSKKSTKSVDKFTDAVSKTDRHLCECYFTEGDSARASIQSARGKNPYIGSYSLRGKPKNVFEEEPKDIIAPRKNKKGEPTGDLPELANVMLILGLEFGVKVTSVDQLRFGKIVILSDQDLDGFHITGLLLAFFAKFWPELFSLGVIYRMNTPLFIATVGKSDTYEFFTEEEYGEWAKTAPKHKADYYKGLGGFDTEVFEGFIHNRQKYLTQFAPLTQEDLGLIEMAFGKSEQEARKEWLEDIRYFDSIDA
jgi:DNA topoisomerase-2